MTSAPYTRAGDPATSFQAAQSVKPHLSKLKKWILDALRRRGPMTHEEMYEAYFMEWPGPHHKEQSVRSRCNELVKDNGLVIDSGERRRMRDGNLAVVWELADDV